MFQVLKSPRDTEESRIKDLASHIHRSQFRFSNSFGCISAAAFKNKPRRFIRQVIRSKIIWSSKLFRSSELIGNQSEGDSQPSASWRRVQPPPFRKFRVHQSVEVETETPNIRTCSVIADRKYRTLPASMVFIKRWLQFVEARKFAEFREPVECPNLPSLQVLQSSGFARSRTAS